MGVDWKTKLDPVGKRASYSSASPELNCPKGADHISQRGDR